MVYPAEIFDLEGYRHRELFPDTAPVWTALDRLPAYLASFFIADWPLAGHAGLVTQPPVISGGVVRRDLTVRAVGPKNTVRAFQGDRPQRDVAIVMPGVSLFDDRVIIGPGTVVEPGALLKGPTVIGDAAEVRQGAYIRGDCLIGDGCVVGHDTEVKGAIMIDSAKASHFAYVGDSILSRGVNLGAGTKLANLKMARGTITFTAAGERHDTGRCKLGAILGDGTETGCNSVTAPGTLMLPGSIVYAAVSVPAGYYPARSYFRLSRDVLQVRMGKSDTPKK